MAGLTELGVDAWSEGDDLYVEGQPGLRVPPGKVLDSRGDHRLAMTWALAGLCGDTPVSVTDFESVNVSYPGFLDDMWKVARQS